MNLKYHCVEDITEMWVTTVYTAFALRYGVGVLSTVEMSGRPFDTWVQWVGVPLAAILYATVTPGYTLSFEGVSFCFFNIKSRVYSWKRYPYSGRVSEGVKVYESKSTGKDNLYFCKKKLKKGKEIPMYCHILKYTEEMEAILCIFCPHLENPDIALWKERLSDVRVWSDAELQENRNKVKRYKLLECALFTPAIIAAALMNNQYIPIIIFVIVTVGWSVLKDKYDPKQEKVEQEYQRALLKRLVLYLSHD